VANPVRSAFDWFFRSRRTGRITIAQFPNAALWIFLATVVTRQFVTTGSAARTPIDYIAALSLGAWAVDEVVRGENPGRRVLGAGGCAFAISGLVSLLR
jgi:hypothetical protein